MDEIPANLDEPVYFPEKPGWRRYVLVGLLLVLAVLAGVYLQRETIVRNIVAGQLQTYGIAADYDIVSIGPRQQVLRNVRIGDAARPDLAIQQVVIDLSPTFGGVAIDRIKIDGARLFGSYRGGKLSFGALDPLLESDSTEPFEFPDFAVDLVDARVKLVTDFGDFGGKAEGSGNLRDGFTGRLAVVSDTVQAGGCAISAPSLYGTVRIVARQPEFAGPLRNKGITCDTGKLALGAGAAQLALKLDRDLMGVTGKAQLAQGTATASGLRLVKAAGPMEFRFRDNLVSGRVEVALSDSRYAGTKIGQFGVKGRYSATTDLSSADFDGAVSVDGVQAETSLWRSLDAMAAQSAETPVGPLVAKLAQTGRAQLRNVSGEMRFVVDHHSDMTRLSVPSAVIAGSSGSNIASLRGISAAWTPRGLSGLTGGFSTGGAGLPAMNGSVRPAAAGGTQVKLALSPYTAETARLAVSQIAATIAANGSVRFAGAAQLSGPMPSGVLRNLALPIKGDWSPGAGLALYRGCETLRFDALSVSGMTLGQQALRLCPNGGAIVRQDAAGNLRIGAQMAAANIAGRLGDTPLQLQSGGLDFAYPGNLSVRDMRVAIGRSDFQTLISADSLAVAFGQSLTGSYTGGEATIGTVPLLLSGGAGPFSYANGVLALTDGAWQVSDRAEERRFLPLVSNDMQLSLIDGAIRASGQLREPTTGRDVMAVQVQHELSSGLGNADLAVADLGFDKVLQPEMITPMALGVIANVNGSVRGTGRIDWGGPEVTSTGRFRTDDLDLAAAFGPVTDLSGEIVFTDLLAMATAPGQIVKIGEVNPGIPAFNGVVRYQLLPNQLMQVESGEWPFSGGRLRLEPTLLDLSTEKVRRLTFAMEGLSAAEFLTRFEFDNITATGTFDGRLPMVFDQDGGRIEGGRLDARPGGGSIAYVGELTYEDLGAMGNYAFSALKSMKYDSLSIDINGAIDGEIITGISFAGLSQGEGASQNFITRQIAKLPIIFNVTITAPFLQLITSARSLYDPEFIRDPQTLGIVDRATTPTDEPAVQ